MHNYRGQNFKGRYRGNLRNDTFGRGRGRTREKHNVTLGEMIEAGVDRDQAQEQVPIEIGLYALSVGSMIICQKLSKYIRYRKEQSELIQ